jgi:hypothetical protein
MHILLYGDKQMSKTKIAIALVALGAIAIVAVGLASAQLSANQTYTDPATGTTVPYSGGFFGWLGRCFGLGPAQTYYGNPYVAPMQPANSSATAPYAPYQGGYGYGYGYGPCWARW